MILLNKLRFLILFWGSLATINFDSIVLILISALSIENNYFPLVSGRLKMPYLSLYARTAYFLNVWFFW